MDPRVYGISGAKFFATSVRGFAVTESILLTSVFRTLVTAHNKDDSEHGGVRVNYPEVYNTCVGCLRGVRKVVELDCAKFIVRSENLSWNWMTGNKWKLFPGTTSVVFHCCSTRTMEIVLDCLG